MSTKHLISETFFSLEGEAQFTFLPTVYVRYAGCNLKCPKFNNPFNFVTENGYAPLNFKPSELITLSSMPNITHGCDTQYATNREFQHLWKTLTTHELTENLVSMLPNRKWTYDTGLDIICSITGGEPTMHQDEIIELMNHPLMQDCRHFLIETNATIPLKQNFIDGINKWLSKPIDVADGFRNFTFSNSPKLSSSGENWKRTIRPSVIKQQHSIDFFVNQYFKFVVDGTEESYIEVKKALEEFNTVEHGCNRIYIMPMACTTEQQKEISQSVARRCMQEGWIYSHRIQNDLWDNAVGS